MPDVYLGIDLGTSELKLALLEGHRLVASVGEPVITARPQPHWVEQNPADWWMALDAAMLRMRAAHPVAMAGVRAIGPSGQMHGAVLLDVGQRCWSDELLSACHLTCAQMPRLIEGSDVSGQLRPALADRWGLRPGLCVAGGGGDNAASAVGIGAVQPNQGFISLGTDAPTTLGLVGLDAQGVPTYTFYGEGAADRQLELDAFRLLPAKLRAIHIGSFATVVEPIASTVRALVERERSRTLICYDPNVRLNVEPDLDRWRDMPAMDAIAHAPSQDQRRGSRPVASGHGYDGLHPRCTGTRCRTRHRHAGQAWRASSNAVGQRERASSGRPIRRHRRRRRRLSGGDALVAG